MTCGCFKITDMCFEYVILKAIQSFKFLWYEALATAYVGGGGLTGKSRHLFGCEKRVRIYFVFIVVTIIS